MPRDGQGRYAAMRSSVPGNNPYSMMSSDIYQDLFEEGSFVGKGIYDIDIFVQSTANTCPENLVLSHDLLEGCYARAGLLSEVLLYEQYPNNYLSDSARRTRNQSNLTFKIHINLLYLDKIKDCILLMQSLNPKSIGIVINSSSTVHINCRSP